MVFQSTVRSFPVEPLAECACDLGDTKGGIIAGRYVSGFDNGTMKKVKEPRLFMTQVFGEPSIGGIAKRLRQQSFDAGGEAAGGDVQAMRRDLVALISVAKRQSVQQ